MQNWIAEVGRGLIRGLSVLCGVLLGLFCVFGLGYKLVCQSKPSCAYEIKPSGNAKGMFVEIDKNRSLLLEVPLKGTIGLDLTPDVIIEAVEEAFSRANSGELRGISAILLVIDSPGGYLDESVRLRDCFQNWKVREQIPLYVFVEGTCASGALLACCGADKIFAHTFARIGSIGVMQIACSIKGLIDHLGINLHALAAGKGKTDCFFGANLEKEAIARKQFLLDQLYAKFIESVSKGRNLDQEKIRKVGAKIFLAEEALTHGLIDELVMSREHFLERVEALLGAEGASVVCVKKVVSWREKVGCWAFTWLKELCFAKNSWILGKSA